MPESFGATKNFLGTQKKIKAEEHILANYGYKICNKSFSKCFIENFALQ